MQAMTIYSFVPVKNPISSFFSTENFYLLIVTSESKEKDVEENEDIGFFTGTKLYIVIACIAALTLVAIVQIGCTIYKMANKPSSGSKDQQVEHGLDQESRMYNNNSHLMTRLQHHNLDPI